jgi:ElaB/YqjD/DUF883 family membrane-anchored ribosome-binding protein
MDTQQAGAEARQGMEGARDAFADRLADARERIKVKTDKAVEAGRDLYGRAANRAQDLAGNVDTMIDDQPYAALAVAAVAGLAVGLILGLTLGGRD